MNKINPLFEAMSNIDDNMVAGALPKKKKISLPITFTAAAAVAVLLLMGNAIAFRSEVRLGNGVVIDYNISKQTDMIVPTEEELLEMGAVPDKDSDMHTLYNIKALPSQIFEKFNLDILINDNFIEKPSVDIWFFSSIDDPKTIRFSYLLTDKALDSDVLFSIMCRSDEYGYSSYNQGKPAEDKVYTLKDGSKALVWKWSDVDKSYAAFSYGGNVYELEFWHKGLERDFTIDDMEQVLKDLGVL